METRKPVALKLWDRTPLFTLMKEHDFKVFEVTTPKREQISVCKCTICGALALDIQGDIVYLRGSKFCER